MKYVVGIFIFYAKKTEKCVAYWRESAWYQLCNFSALHIRFPFFYFLRGKSDELDFCSVLGDTRAYLYLYSPVLG